MRAPRGVGGGPAGGVWCPPSPTDLTDLCPRPHIAPETGLLRAHAGLLPGCDVTRPAYCGLKPLVAVVEDVLGRGVCPAHGERCGAAAAPAPSRFPVPPERAFYVAEAFSVPLSKIVCNAVELTDGEFTAVVVRVVVGTVTHSVWPPVPPGGGHTPPSAAASILPPARGP